MQWQDIARESVGEQLGSLAGNLLSYKTNLDQVLDMEVVRQCFILSSVSLVGQFDSVGRIGADFRMNDTSVGTSVSSAGATD